MKSKWIEHNGKKIMFCDYANFRLDTPALKAEIDEVNELLLKEPPNSVLIIVDSANTVGSMENFNYVKDSSRYTKNVVTKTAVIGLTGKKLVLMNLIARAVGINIAAFDDIESAKDWLVQ